MGFRGCAAKAHDVDAAHQAASELALLAGAAGFTADSRTASTRAALNALLVACLQREVAARESHGGEGRIRASQGTLTFNSDNG